MYLYFIRNRSVRNSLKKFRLLSLSGRVTSYEFISG